MVKIAEYVMYILQRQGIVCLVPELIGRLALCTTK